MNKFIKSRFFWLFVACIAFVCVFVAHFVFQVWLFMPPCENCVYIRYFFLCVFLGAMLAFLAPKLGILGYISVIYGCSFGIFTSYKLHKIHASIASGDIFGFTPCKMTPSFHFGLKLDELMPELFKPLALCGSDAPLPPLDATFSALQGFFIDLYRGGWFLLPKYEFMDMAQCCAVIFALILGLAIFRMIKCKSIMF